MSPERNNYLVMFVDVDIVVPDSHPGSFHDHCGLLILLGTILLKINATATNCALDGHNARCATGEVFVTEHNERSGRR